VSNPNNEPQRKIPAALFEGVQRLHSRLSEIARIPRGNSEVVLKRSGGNHSIQERQCLSLPLQIRHQSGPSPADRDVPRNQPLTGQASSSFTSPSLRRRSFRFRRYSPRSIRSISNSCPGSTPSFCRISAGMMIWPLVETVVLIQGKILSYRPGVNRLLIPTRHSPNNKGISWANR